MIWWAVSRQPTKDGYEGTTYVREKTLAKEKWSLSDSAQRGQYEGAVRSGRGLQDTRIALRDGTVVKIPESNLILPSVTIQGITAILRDMGVKVEERPLTYGELKARTRVNELVAVCSVGTAGILNRCAKLVFVDGRGHIQGAHTPDTEHPLYAKLAEAKEYYWNVYRGAAKPVAGMTVYKYTL